MASGLIPVASFALRVPRVIRYQAGQVKSAGNGAACQIHPAYRIFPDLEFVAEHHRPRRSD